MDVHSDEMSAYEFVSSPGTSDEICHGVLGFHRSVDGPSPRGAKDQLVPSSGDQKIPVLVRR